MKHSAQYGVLLMDFGGGGHTFAAGCTIKKPIAIAFDKLLSAGKRLMTIISLVLR